MDSKRPAATRAPDSLTAAVLDILRVGQENSLSREQLVHWLRSGYRGWGEEESLIFYSVSDRQIRDAITSLRLDGHLIANLGTGYFVAATPAELAAYLAQERARTRTLEAVLRAMESSPEAARLAQQMELSL